MDGRRKRRGAIWAGVAVGAVVVSGVGLWATDSPPFRDSYCWGAWQQDSGPDFLGEKGLAKSGSERKATESAQPSAGRHLARCTVTVQSTVPDDDSDESLTFQEQVTAEYGPVPSGAEDRRAWIARYFDGSGTRLPDGLDGLVSPDRAMLVLPRACDVDGRPSAVTIRSGSTGDGHLGKVTMPFTIGTRSEVTRMLVDLANTGMGKAGCAPAEPLRTTSPVVTIPEDAETAMHPLCRIPGVTVESGKDSEYRQQVGVVDGRLQTCSVAWRARGVPDEPAAQYVMTSEPRLAALFDGLPEGAAEGLTRTECKGRRTVFYGHLGTALKGAGEPDDRTVFERFTESVGRRIGCGSGEGA
ncbi:hypothetical protein ACFCV8_24315 [Streptomyces sp. NPDC056347]|uniref:hypothetical protein n=1 Tax=Streptomyces sp. NPDC056347 TaxID=3345790 RepID=UPI0035E33375